MNEQLIKIIETSGVWGLVLLFLIYIIKKGMLRIDIEGGEINIKIKFFGLKKEE